MCVTGETIILTDKGYYPIEELENAEVNVWNGNKYIRCLVRFNGVDNVHRVTFDNSFNINCTTDHIHNNTTSSYTIPVRHRHVMNMPYSTEQPNKPTYNPYIQGYCSGMGLNRDIVKVNPIALQSFLDANVPRSPFDPQNFIVTKFISHPISIIPFDLDLNDQKEWMTGYLHARPELLGKSIWNEEHQLSTNLKLFMLSLGMSTIGETSQKKYMTIPSSRISNIEPLYEAEVFCLENYLNDSIHEGMFNGIVCN